MGALGFGPNFMWRSPQGGDPLSQKDFSELISVPELWAVLFTISTENAIMADIASESSNNHNSSKTQPICTNLFVPASSRTPLSGIVMYLSVRKV